MEEAVASTLLLPQTRSTSVIEPFMYFGDALAPEKAKSTLGYWNSCASE